MNSNNRLSSEKKNSVNAGSDDEAELFEMVSALLVVRSEQNESSELIHINYRRHKTLSLATAGNSRRDDRHLTLHILVHTLTTIQTTHISLMKLLRLIQQRQERRE